MFWEKKEEKKGLPELPPMKPFSSFKVQKREEVPENFSVPSEEMQDYEEELPKLPEKFRFPKMVESRKMSQEIAETKSEEVYVKIDRFHSARKALNSARDKLKEIDESMRKIRETRLREEQELAFWEKEISNIKTKVEDVTKNIFEKIE